RGGGGLGAGTAIGGTRGAVLAVGLRGVDVLSREVFPTQATLGAARLRGQLATVLARLRSELGLHARLPVGVSVPELVDLDGLVATDVVVPGLTGDLKQWVEIGVDCVESDV